MFPPSPPLPPPPPPLQVNTKLGGRNQQISVAPNVQALPGFSEVPTILFGADVTHPPPGAGDGAVSIAAVVASMVSWAVRADTRTRGDGAGGASAARDGLFSNFFFADCEYLCSPRLNARSSLPPPSRPLLSLSPPAVELRRGNGGATGPPGDDQCATATSSTSPRLLCTRGSADRPRSAPIWSLTPPSPPPRVRLSAASLDTLTKKHLVNFYQRTNGKKPERCAALGLATRPHECMQTRPREGERACRIEADAVRGGCDVCALRCAELFGIPPPLL